MIVELRDSGVGILLIEQNAVMALSVSNYGYILSHGRVTKEGAATTLLADPEIQTFYLGLDRAAAP
jgi:branched-chain amino acid transport system ATP-binding protein